MKFEWDDEKARSNLDKHGISFSLAERVFDDVWRLERAGEDDDWHGEERWITTGVVGGVELVVVYTIRGDTVRLISPRWADMSETSIGTIVTDELDSANPRPFTVPEIEQLERLRGMRDEDIDFSDIPNQAGKPGGYRPGLFGGPVGALRRAALAEKLLLVDADVLEFFRKAGESAPERMNAVLREYVEEQRKTRLRSELGGVPEPIWCDAFDLPTIPAEFVPRRRTVVWRIDKSRKPLQDSPEGKEDNEGVSGTHIDHDLPVVR